MNEGDTARQRAVRWAGRLAPVLVFALLGCDSWGSGGDDEDTASDRDTETADPKEEDTGFVTEDGIVYPGLGWPKADPEAEGMDPTLLESAAELAEENDSHCLVVTKGGKIVGEWYFDDWDAQTASNVYSVTKSLASMVVGIAEKAGLLDIEQLVSEFVPSWSEHDSRHVLIRHLLSNTSGREWTFLGDSVQLSTQTDATAYALGLGQDYPPETHWDYNNAAVQALDGVLTEALGEAVSTWATEQLFDPIDSAISFSEDASGNTLLYSEARASCRDLARIGYLVLRNGRWGDTQLIDSTYLLEATTSSSTLNEAYGYLWWLNTDGHWIEPATGDAPPEEGDGKMWPDAPERMIVAHGLQAQLIVIDPAEELVFTRIGGDPNPVTAALSGEDLQKTEFVEGLLRRIFASLPEAGSDSEE